MVVRIHNLTKWHRLPPGGSFNLTGSGLRRVRIEVNCEQPTSFQVIEGEHVAFLAVVQGLETLEFSVSDDIASLVPTSEGDVWFFTNHGDVEAFDAGFVESFTKLANRRARNPALEQMMFKLEQNMTRRLSRQSEELAAIERRIEARAASADEQTGELPFGHGTGPEGASVAEGEQPSSAELPAEGALNGA